MKKIIFILGITILVTGVTATLALACSCGESAKAAGSIPPSCQCSADSCGSGEEAALKEAVPVNNTVCPVSGKPVGSMGEETAFTYQGRTYQLCCGGCVEQFKADPEKYIKKIQQN